MKITQLEKDQLDEYEKYLNTHSLTDLTGIYNYAYMHNLWAKYMGEEARNVFRKMYINAVGPEKAFEAGSSICSQFEGFSHGYEDPELMDLALKIISKSSPARAEELLTNAVKEMKESNEKPVPDCAYGDSFSLSDILGDVVPGGRRDRTTGLITPNE